MTRRPVVFFGSSPFSVIVLEKLLTRPNGEGPTLSAVVTEADKPAGRHLKLTPNPVKLLAQKHHLPVFETINDYCMTTNDNCVTIGLVAAYGKIITQDVLSKFNGRIYNIHPSLLPKYRGPSPLQQQILDGVSETGVTLIQLDALMDHGPIAAQATDKILPDDTWLSLGHRLFTKGTDLFLSQLQKATPFEAKVQNHSFATYTHKLTRQSGFLPWEEFESQTTNHKPQINRRHRALVGWPGVWTLTPSGQRLKLVSLEPQILVQPEGRSPLPWSQFLSHKTPTYF